SQATVTRPLSSAAMAGFHSLPSELDTVAVLENELPSCTAAKIDALPFRHPCHATQTRPLASVAATGTMSEPAAVGMRCVAPGCPCSMARAQMSKLPPSLALQNTQGRPLPSTAIAGRHKSPPGGVMAKASLHDPFAYFRSRI